MSGVFCAYLQLTLWTTPAFPKSVEGLRLSNGASLLSGGGQVYKVTQVTMRVLPRLLRNSSLTLTLQITDYQ